MIQADIAFVYVCYQHPTSLGTHLECNACFKHALVRTNSTPSLANTPNNMSMPSPRDPSIPSRALASLLPSLLIDAQHNQMYIDIPDQVAAIQSSHLTNPNADLILMFPHPPLLPTEGPFSLPGEEEQDARTPTIFSNRLEYLYMEKDFRGKPHQNYYQSVACERDDDQRHKTGRDSGRRGYNGGKRAKDGGGDGK